MAKLRIENCDIERKTNEDNETNRTNRNDNGGEHQFAATGADY
jgi:hypothetical protein